MAINFLNNVGFNKNQLIELVIHNETSAPTSPVVGQMYYNTIDNNLYVYDGAWVDLTSQGAGSTNITVVEGGSTVEIQSSTGTNDSIAAATITTAGVMTSSDKAKLDAILGTNTGDQTITLTGDVTGTGTGSFNTTIGNNKVTLAKFQQINTDSFLGRDAAGTGNVEILSVATAKTLLNLTGTNSGDQTITLQGDVSGTGTGTFDVTIQNSAVEAGMLNNNVISGQTTALTSGLAGTDELLISDAGTIKKMDVSVMNAYFNSALNFTDNDGTVTGTGTAGTLPVWSTGGTGIEDSIVSQSGGTLFVAGNLDVSGTNTIIDSTTVAIGDNMMKYAKDNTSNTSDIGWYGVINDGTAKYSGMWYDASTGTTTPKFVLGIATTEPAGTGTIATPGVLVADLEGNADTADAWSSSTTVTFATGDVTGSFSIDGSTNVNNVDLTIANDAVTYAQIQNVAGNNVFLGNDNGTNQAVQELSVADAKALLNLTGTNSGDQTITLTNDVTGTGTGSFATTIANNAVTLAKMADVNSGTVFYRKTAGSGDPEVQTLATLKTDLNLTGTNSGDETSAGEGNEGIVFLATKAEVQAGTNISKVVTPDTLASKSVVSQILTASLNNNTATITHNLGTEDIIVQLFDSTTKETVFADVARTTAADAASTNIIKITFGQTPPNNVDVLITSIKGATSVTPVYPT